MEEKEQLLRDNTQHSKLSIIIASNEKSSLPAHVYTYFQKPNKVNYYFLVFVRKGSFSYGVDLDLVPISQGKLLFVLPNQVISHPESDNDAKYYKMAFDDSTLALLPQQFHFLINPLNQSVLTFNAPAAARVSQVFEMLLDLLHDADNPADATVVLAYLNALLIELDGAYFESHSQLAGPDLSKYIKFKLAVETQLTEQTSVFAIARQMAITTSSLYNVVKKFSGISPKEFITNRLMLEAQRKLRYSKPSVKELAFELGYNDPDYFSRQFKKVTGKSVSQFVDGRN